MENGAKAKVKAELGRAGDFVSFDRKASKFTLKSRSKNIPEGVYFIILSLEGDQGLTSSYAMTIFVSC